jgi:hypothetical protein
VHRLIALDIVTAGRRIPVIEVVAFILLGEGVARCQYILTLRLLTSGTDTGTHPLALAARLNAHNPLTPDVGVVALQALGVNKSAGSASALLATRYGAGRLTDDHPSAICMTLFGDTFGYALSADRTDLHQFPIAVTGRFFIGMGNPNMLVLPTRGYNQHKGDE